MQPDQPPLTDDALLELVQSKTPEELTLDEIALLRRRLAESETLRTALFETLQMEAYLSAALGQHEQRADLILQRARAAQGTATRPMLLIIGVVACSLLFLMLGGALIRAALHSDTPIALPPKAPEEKPEEKPQPETTPETPQPPVEPSKAKTPEPPPDKPKVETPVEPPKPAPPPKVEDPWQAVLDLPEDKVPEFGEVCFNDFPYRIFLPRKDHLRLWFETHDGKKLAVQEVDTRKGKVGQIEGIARLRAPLPADGGFRFALENYNRLQIHVYHQNIGVTLFYLEDQRNRWAAYATTRKPGSAKPETFALTATDDDRARRAEVRHGGPLELRYRDGELLLLRGDIALVKAQLPGAPTEIFFDGRAAFEGLSLVRTKNDAIAQEPIAKLQTQPRPTEIAWQTKLSEGAQLVKSDDGSIRVTSKEPKEPSYIYAPQPGIGLRETILELRDVLPGSHVFFTHGDGLVTELLRFAMNNRTKRLTLGFRGPDDFYTGDLPPLGEQMEIAVGSNVWVKLLYGTGSFRFWVSADGKHWALGDPVHAQMGGNITGIGIGTCRTKEASGLTLQSVATREFETINSLAARDLVEKAPSNNSIGNFEAWHAAVVKSCPAGVALPEWRRACALKSLQLGHAQLSPRFLEMLVDDPQSQALPFEKQLQLLTEVMQVEFDPRDGQTWKRGYLTRIRALAEDAARQGKGLPFSLSRQALMQTPTSTAHALPIAPEGAMEPDLVALLEADRTSEALAFCRMLRLYHFDEQRPLVPWAEATARRELGRTTGDAARIKDGWRQPLVEELNKEVYNFAADLKSIVDSGALDDASRMIASLESDRGGGLAPSGSDPDLFVSLGVAVKLALVQHPELRTQLSERLAPLAQLRVRQAINSGDVEAIDLVATQFEGTESAAEAHRWLGDRALQNGWFARALAEYHRATSPASSSLSRDIAQRARLAAAMIGRDYGKPVTENVSFGELKLSPGEFEALVNEMKSRGAGSVMDASPLVRGPIPAPTQLTPTNRARLDGAVGQNPHDDGARFISQWQIDFAGRQIAASIEGEMMYVSNRFQLAAYNANNGQRVWQTPAIPGEMRRGQDWPLIAMRPLITSTAIYARQLYGKSPSLGAFEKASGKLLWSREGTEREWIASDPIFVQGQLLALVLQRLSERENHLKLVSLDPLTGEILFQRKLVSLRDSWQQRKVCELAPLDDGLIATIGGATLCCDAAGNLRWVRKALQLPPEEMPDWIQQYFAPPIIEGDRVLVAQPGVASLDCLEVTTGRKLWSFSREQPRRVLGISAGQVIAETDRGIISFDLATGDVKWRHDESFPRLAAAAVDAKHVLYVIKRGPSDKPKVPTAIWLDVATGKTIGAAELTPWQDPDPRMGPLVLAKDRMWTFFSREKDPNKDVVELVPSGTVLPFAPLDVDDPWRRTLSPQLVQTVSEVAPGWQLISGYPRPNAEKKAEWQGEKDAALVLARPDLPLVIARSIKIPANMKSKLLLRVGHEPNEPGKLEVRFGNEVIFSQDWKGDNANRWDSAEIHLDPYKGQSGLLSVTYQPAGGNDHACWIRQLELKAE